MAPTSGQPVVNQCKYCSKKVDNSSPKCVSCENCENVFHLSCSQRNRGNKIVDLSRNLILCYQCNEEEVYLSDDSRISSEKDALRREIQLLRSLLIEKDARIQELIKINGLLEDKIAYTQNLKIADQVLEKSSTDKNSNLQKNIVDNKGKHASYATKTKVSESTKSNQISGNSSSTKNSADNLEVMVNKQRQIMSHVIELESDLPNRNDDKEFKTVVRRKTRKNIAKGVAETRPEDSFRGKPSKMWLFVGRAVESVQEIDVATYIKKKCSFDNDELLSVKKLSVLGNTNSFQVGIDPKYYDLLVKSEFWPSGIIVRRFRFRSGNQPQRAAPGNFQAELSSLADT